MARTSVHVRPAVPADVPALVLLWAETRDSPDLAVRAASRAEDAEDRFASLIEDPEVTILVAVGDGDDVYGFSVIDVGRLGPFAGTGVLRVSLFLVRSDMRRHGVGSALLLACAEQAHAVGFNNLVVEAPPTDRDVNRFFARLGFAPLVVRRQASVTALMRRLAPAAAEPERRRAALGLRRGRMRKAATAILVTPEVPHAEG